MPHTAEDKQRAITRLRRIRGQAEALERAVQAGSDCAPILQQLAAMRGAVPGLMADPLVARMPAVANGALVMLDNDAVGTGANPTPLSIPWVLEDYADRLAKAARAAE